MIKIKVGVPEATVELNARKALDGSLLIMDHSKIDIAVMPESMKVVLFPKSSVAEDVYEFQDRLLELLSDKGIVDRSTIQGGNVYRSLEGKIFENDSVNPLQAAAYVIAEFVGIEAQYEKTAKQYEDQVDKLYSHPTDRDSTEYGEVPQHGDKGSMRPGYYYYPLRNRY